jgi:ATP-binding cassette, subfamily C, bacterial LapB
VSEKTPGVDWTRIEQVFSRKTTADGIHPGAFPPVGTSTAPPMQADWEDNSKNPPVAPLHSAVLVGTVFINLLALALPLVVLQVYDRIIPNQALDTFLLLLIGLSVVLLLDGILRVSRAYLVGWAGVCFENEVAVEAVERILFAPSSVIEQNPPGIHIDRLNAIDALRDFYGGQSRLLLIDLPFVVVFLGLVAAIGGWIVIVPLLMFATLSLVTMICGNHLREVLEQRAEQDDRRYDFIIEALNGIQTIKTMAMEPQIQRRFERLQKAGVSASYKTIKLGNLAQNFGNLFSSLTMISVVSVGAYLIINGSLSVGALAACTLLSGRSVQPVLRGLGLWTQLQGLSIAKARLQGVYDLPEVKDRLRLDHTLECKGELKLRNLTYIYDGDENPAIKDISLDIDPGAMIGLHGGDGGGKSTLVKLMIGELAPVSGTLKIDGYEISGPRREQLIRSIAYVPQHSEIFTGTILQNITMFNTGEAIDAAREAARLLGLEADIHRLPEGYDTNLSEGISDELPMGMMQRIIIARNLARKPGILLFDEANSSLDGRADKMLRTAFEKLKGNITVVIVSNRPSLLRLCDHIYELENGEIKSAVIGTRRDNAPAQRAQQEGVAS